MEAKCCQETKGTWQRMFQQKYVNGEWITVAKLAQKRRQSCVKETCKNSNKRHCDEFTEEDCMKIFQSYWSTGDKCMQCTYIQSLVDVVPKQASQGDNRRQFLRNGLSLEVCKDMFLNTLSQVKNYKQYYRWTRRTLV